MSGEGRAGDVSRIDAVDSTDRPIFDVNLIATGADHAPEITFTYNLSKILEWALVVQCISTSLVLIVLAATSWGH